MKILKSFIACLSVIAMACTLNSCADWGQMDPGAATDVYPTREKLVTYAFNESKNLDELTYIVSYDAGAEIVDDDSLYNQSLHLLGAKVSLVNPFTEVKLQNGAGFTFWLRAPETQAVSQMLSLPNGMSLLPEGGIPGLEDGCEHFIGVQVKTSGFALYIDGEAVSSTLAENEGLVACLDTTETIVVGNVEGEYWIDDITFIRNQMTEKDIERPTIKKGKVKLPDPVYFNDFNSGAGDATVVGGGSFRNDEAPGFKKVFQNITGGMRQNYLLLPSDALSHSANTQKMTIGVWVNSVNAGASGDYMWAPLFMAYAAAPNPTNGMPMFACQYRGVLQINNNGWTDYTDAQNTNGANKLYHADTDWLADKQWHYYTAVFDGENAKVYLDGELANEWNMDGTTNTQMGLFTNGADLKYICLGGNQAWDWGDNDPGFAFDDVVIYDDALSKAQIEQIITDKPNSGGGGGVDLPTPVFFSDFSNTSGLEIVGGGSFTKDADSHFGQVFQNITGGMRQNYLLLPADALSHSAQTNQMSIGVWVNAANAGASGDYMWAPLFMAYAEAPNPTNGMPMFACQYRGVLQINNNGWTDYTDAQNVAGANKLYHAETDWLADKKWHYYTAVFDGENAKVYLDGVIANEWNMDGTTNTQSGLYTNGADLKYICLGGNQAWDWGDNDPGFAFDDIAIYDKALTETDIKNIMDVKMGNVPVSGPKPYYRNTFDDMNGAQIVGGGSIADDPVHGKIFQNVTGGMRQNYLLLPEDLLSHSAESKQFSMSVWVNSANAGASGDYMWAPLFMAYAAAPNPTNGMPMFACQYRGVLQINNNGWTDYTDAQNVAGANKLYHAETDWLADKEWHLYTVVFDGENAKVYFDGVIANEWNMDGTTNTQSGLYTNGADFKYICLGGNQAWDWGDNDPGFAFDDIQCFDFALSASDIEAIMKQY